MTQDAQLALTRRYEMDWLRVLAFGLLIFFHIGMYYVEDWHWHIKSQYQGQWLQYIMMWSSQWRMSLLFLISGSAVAFILQRMSLQQFVRSRQSRVLLPLVFGVFVVVVPQVYVEMASQGRLEGVSPWQFWLAYLDQSSPLFVLNKTVADIHLTWNHLWFLSYIWLYSMLAWAAYAIGRRLPVRNWQVLHPSSFVGAMLLPLLILWLCRVLWVEQHPVTNNLVDDLYNHSQYFCAFVMGVIFVHIPAYWLALKRWRGVSLLLGLICYVLMLASRFTDSLPQLMVDLAYAGCTWFWISAICGYGQRWLSGNHKVLAYLNGGVFCYYILHQTLIILIAYGLAPYNLGPILEPVCLIVVTFAGCFAGYEVLRRIAYVRALFGISRPKQKTGPGLSYNSAPGA